MRPRIRSVKPEMRKDERYGRMSRDARELFNGMITMADDEGRFRALSSAILGDVFPYDEDAPRKLKIWVAEVKASGMVVFYVVDGTPYGAFRHWARHQKINRPSPSELPPPPDGTIVRDNAIVESDRGWKQARGDVDLSGSITNGSVNAHGSNSEGSLSLHRPPGACAFRSDPDPIPVLSQPTAELRTRALCHRLAVLIRRNDPKANVDFERAAWINEMRLLVVARGDDDAAFLEVERMIDWCQADSFWRSNILCPSKLRKQFTALTLRADQSKPMHLRAVAGGGERDFDKYNRAAGLA